MEEQIEAILEKFNENLSDDYWSTSMGVSENKFDIVAKEITELLKPKTKPLEERKVK